MSFDEVYGSLLKFVYYLAAQREHDAALLGFQEIKSELFEEMVKGYARYGHLPRGQLLAVIRKMMDNRLSELTHKYYLTHRGLGVNAKSMPEADEAWFEDVVWTSDGNDCSVLEEFLDSKERVEETLNALSREDRKVLLSVLYGCPGLEKQIKLSGLRASFVYTARGTIRIKPWHVAEALEMEEEDVKKSFKEIERAYAEVVNGSV